LTIAAATIDAPGDVIMGDHDPTSAIIVPGGDPNDTYTFYWSNALANVAGLTLNDVQMGLRIWYHI
jgi:hypothetical protein